LRTTAARCHARRSPRGPSGAGDGDLELARQELELRMVGRPLPQQFGIGAGIGDLVGGGTGEMVGRDVAHAIARGLDRMHPDIGQRGQHRRAHRQFRPVELDVLPGGEMAVALVPGLGDMGQLAHLAGVQRAIGHGDPQHIGMQLQIEAVHQPQRAELIFGQAAVQPARPGMNCATRLRTKASSKSE
jgi:hypothetical protein